MLTPVNQRSNLKYAAWRLPSAISRAWLEEEVRARLDQANALVRQRTSGQAEICVWDALRPFEVQQHLFDQEIRRAQIEHPHLSPDELHRLVSSYVRPPRQDLPPPHTTGGAVDVTLWWDGDDSSLGEFDDFTEYGRADYFQRHPPESSDEHRVMERRLILRTAMFEVGFVGIDEEWWHYEYGTRTWAEASQTCALFDRVQLPPADPFLAEMPSYFSHRQLVDVHGVAHEFGSAKARVDALQGRAAGFYYARTRHPNEREASRWLAELVGEEDAVLLPSGLSAAVESVSANVSRGGKVLVDATIYYETRLALETASAREGWSLVEADLSSVPEDRHIWEGLDAAFCDHPRNWLLTTPDLDSLRRLSGVYGAKLIVDTSVQPLQMLGRLGLADLTVMSLSKYPTMGETLAGAVLGPESELEKVRRFVRDRGVMLSPETCATLLQHLRTLEDRMAAVSRKAERVADYLRKDDMISEVRLPDLSRVGAECGGQLTCRFHEAEAASRVEEAVGWNASMGSHFPLALACTFGASFTTFEAFGTRLTTEESKPAGSEYIDPTWVRVGIGHEPVQEIIGALQFALHTARTSAVAA